MRNSRSMDRNTVPVGNDHSTQAAGRTVCTAVIGSMTLAMKAQRALASAAIRVSVIKVGSSNNRNGCAYGVEFPCNQANNVRTVLARAGIAVREYIGG